MPSPQRSPTGRLQALDDLRRELGAEPPAAIAGLPDAQIETLGRVLAGARQHQAAALDAAVDQGLGFIPRLARAAVKRTLFA